MYLQGKYIYDLTPEDLGNLITNEVKEGINLEYKKNINIEGEKVDDNRHEFFCDIAAMYNSNGGCIIYGIDEKRVDKKTTGYPEKFVHQEIKSEDKLEQLIHSLLNSNTDPSITNVAIKFLTVQECLVLIIGVPRGLEYPSMVTFRDINKFFKRNTSGRYAVFTSELNQMFMQSQTIKERADNFRVKRIEYVTANERYNNRHINGTSFIHIIPFSFLEEKVYDITILHNDIKNIGKVFPDFKTINTNYHYFRSTFNFEGFYVSNTFRGTTDKEITYLQFYRNGVLEIFSRTANMFRQTEVQSLEELLLYKDLLFSILAGLKSIKKLQIEPPFLLYLSICDIGNYHFLKEGGIVVGQFSNPNIYLPPIILNTLDIDTKDLFTLLRPNLDIIYQTAGIPRCSELKSVLKDIY